MANTETRKFLDWLKTQDYWVQHKKVEEKFPNLEFKKFNGITLTHDANGNTLIPRRDLKNLLKNQP